jgi:hypothetical protein
MRGKLLIASLLLVSGCQTRILEQEGVLRVEPSTLAGSDYVVQLRNSLDFGFDPDNTANRHKWALHYIKSQCPNGRVVSDRAVETGTYALGRPARTHFVYIACR